MNINRLVKCGLLVSKPDVMNNRIFDHGRFRIHYVDHGNGFKQYIIIKKFIDINGNKRENVIFKISQQENCNWIMDILEKIINSKNLNKEK